ncbi:putative helicase [Streptomyces sp. NBRC 110611]|nr:putative helicase [Streptomyces sp. NBRC 110611]
METVGEFGALPGAARLEQGEQAQQAGGGVTGHADHLSRLPGQFLSWKPPKVEHIKRHHRKT